jgi:hypothetical protein
MRANPTEGTYACVARDELHFEGMLASGVLLRVHVQDFQSFVQCSRKFDGARLHSLTFALIRVLRALGSPGRDESEHRPDLEGFGDANQRE